MLCNKCGASIPENSKFCLNCGASLNSKEAEIGVSKKETNIEKLNKRLSWKILLIVGAVLYIAAYPFLNYGIIFPFISVLGLIMLLLGLVNFVVFLFLKNNDKKVK